MTPQEIHGMLVRLAVEAFEAAVPAPTTSDVAQQLRAHRRDVFLAHACERMAQAAQAIALDLDADADAHAGAGRLVAYMDAAESAENAASHYYPESPLLSHDERVAAERFRELAVRLRARGRT